MPVPTAANPGPADPEASAALLQLIIGSLDDDQAVDTVSIPLAGKSSIADYMVISSGRSTRQVASMANKLGDRIKAETGRPVRMEGLPTADWVLVDAGDIIIHLFRPEVRSFYNLERMWAFGEAPAAPEPLSVIEPLAEDAEDPRTPDDGPPDDLDDDED
ncbi:ribosome silencing factor [Sphingomonas solaris]|uniref:Ribosomal silencing factor RsfS n=1 Tax=Alterirhizorhabdus solaris TaxID=2529389 RepID=A0A558R2W0_9SPHN|nr:ribosome silencing factor [Sphingomonas solaris]TVV73682.1 ribosome silencing factor [Sphingomonas solaris]